MTSTDLFTSPAEEAEGILLELADHIYANTGLKPMSKALFALTRLMLVAQDREPGSAIDAQTLTEDYERISGSLPSPLVDDFKFTEVVEQCGPSLPRILRDVERVVGLARDSDALGLVFNTLVRGKWDSGEGLGTFLTPEEVVNAIVSMVLVRNTALAVPTGPKLIGDICGGTGRFPFTLARRMIEIGHGRDQIQETFFSFDQSSLATDYARLNFHFMDLGARCEIVGDSLISKEVTELTGQCAVLATNPPFGAAKYQVTPGLRETISPKVLERLVNGRPATTVDPSVLFLFRNLDLLSLGGVLGIVLPDGVIQSRWLVPALEDYEASAGIGIEVDAIVSLPSVTFALGGTVAKTSFLVVSKQPKPRAEKMFRADARHIGFLKRKNRRVVDPKGNDLPKIAQAYRSGPEASSESYWQPNWRSWSRLGLSLKPGTRDKASSSPLSDFSHAVREYVHVQNDSVEDVHVSILDVDETGQIDILKSTQNRPSSRSLKCQAGDILISCINPRIWRVAVIPNLPGRWTCSPEFLLLRPKRSVQPYELMLRLHHASFRNEVQRMAGGTSSSRQRVAKEGVLAVTVPQFPLEEKVVERHRISREKYYRTRLKEARLYGSLHLGGGEQGVGLG